jgi:predicted RNA methylase
LITGADLASGHANDRFIEGYAAVPPSRFRNILARWQASEPPHPLAAYTFVDLGCGKGRAVLLASEFGFRETIGVELNPSLAEIARANADRWLADGKAQCPVRIDQADAAEFLWPATPCVVFLFNPFGAEVMRSVVHSLSEAFRDSPDDLEVLYYKPEQGRTFEEKFVTVWCDEVALSAADLASDPVADPHDQTCAYRLRKAAK